LIHCLPTSDCTSFCSRISSHMEPWSTYDTDTDDGSVGLTGEKDDSPGDGDGDRGSDADGDGHDGSDGVDDGHVRSDGGLDEEQGCGGYRDTASHKVNN